MLFEIIQSAFGECSVFGFKASADLLAASLNQRVVSAGLVEAIKVLGYFLKCVVVLFWPLFPVGL